jgi:hypothetical protein
VYADHETKGVHDMLTLAARLPKGFAVTPPSVPAYEQVHRAQMPSPEGVQRSRGNVLHMLVGADGGRFPHAPKRRRVR